MDILIDIDPEKEPELYDRVRAASKILTEEIIRPRAVEFVKSIEWSPVELAGPLQSKRAVRLTLVDCYSGSKEGAFQPVELRSPAHVKSRLRVLWGDFLQQLSDEQMDRLDASFAALGRD
jgi:hypothetical protein